LQKNGKNSTLGGFIYDGCAIGVSEVILL